MATKQDEPRDMNLNPEGKGGFAENPQNRSNGHWKPENTFSYQYRRFMAMSPAELKEWAKTPDDQRTVAMDLAFERIKAARSSIADVKEITDRIEGKAPQFIGLGGETEYKKSLVQFIGGDESD